MDTKLNLIDRFKASYGILKSGTAPVQIQVVDGVKGFQNGMQILNSNASFTESNPYNLALDGYNANAIVYYCVNLVASACASIPLRVYRVKIKNGKRVYEQDAAHPLNKFIRRPNKQMGGYSMQLALHAFNLISGDVYILNRFRNTENMPIGEPFEWDILRPDRMQISDIDGIVSGYEYSKPMGGIVSYPVNRITGKCAVIHIKDFHPINDLFGMSPLEPSMKQIDISNQAARLNKALLDNGARLGVAIRIQEGLDDVTRDNLRKEFMDKYAGSINAGRPMIMEGIDEIKEMGMSPKDIEFQEGQLNAFRLIANAIGVPTYLLGLKDTQSTFNNMAEARSFFYQSTVKQRMLRMYGDTDGDIEGEINLYFNEIFGEDICIKPCWDNVDALAIVREKRYDRATKAAGIATIDEQREMIGLDPLNIEGTTDVPWKSSSESPITFAGMANEDSQDTTEPDEDEQDETDQEDNQKHLKDGIEFKLINNNSQEDRMRELRVFDRLLTVFEKRFSQKIGVLIDSQAKRCADEYAKNKTAASVDTILVNDESRMITMFSKQYSDVMNFFGNRVIDAFAQKKCMVFERKEAQTMFDIAVRRFIEMFAADEVRLVNETTRSQIKTAILQGEQEGMSAREIAKMIVANSGGAIARNRALLISATETHSAASYSQREAAKSATGEDNAEWVSAEDDRTRASHAKADGQRVSNGELFNVGGYKASHPGDPSLPAKERIRCRCTTVFWTDEN